MFQESEVLVLRVPTSREEPQRNRDEDELGRVDVHRDPDATRRTHQNLWPRHILR